MLCWERIAYQTTILYDICNETDTCLMWLWCAIGYISCSNMSDSGATINFKMLRTVLKYAWTAVQTGNMVCDWVTFFVCDICFVYNTVIPRLRWYDII